MFCRPRVRRFSPSDMFCPWFISCGPCVTGKSPTTIPGVRPASNGRPLRRPPRSILRKRRKSPGKLTTTRKFPAPRRCRLSDSPVVVEQHGPELLHHFVDAEQQRDAASLGMWLFLATEIMFFGGMFLAYLIYRYWYYNEFAAGSRSLAIWLG